MRASHSMPTLSAAWRLQWPSALQGYQLGCSSPRLVIWHGKKSVYIKNKFWEYVYKHAKNKYNLDFSGASKKIHLLSNFSIKSNKNFNTSIKNLVLTRLQFKSKNNNINKIKSGFGIFPEINIQNLRELREIIKENFQTITYYGLNKKDIKHTIIWGAVMLNGQMWYVRFPCVWINSWKTHGFCLTIIS